ncbi:MAG: AMP-binding protein [Acidimicrobiia bacterium]
MNDWLVKGAQSDTFLTTPEGTLTYARVFDAMDITVTGRTTVLAPEPNIGSVLAIFAAISDGPLIVRPRHGWIDTEVPESVMTLMFTSGTTGTPKSVPLTVSNWEAAVRASAAHLAHTADDEWLIAMPLHHVGGLSVLFRSAYVGARVRMLPCFEAAEFAEALAGGVTMASVVPTMLRRVLDVDDRSYDGFKAVLVGGGPIPPGLLEEAWGRGIPALPTYGMTETCAQLATLKPGSPLAYRVDPLPGVEVRIESDGRVALRGPQVFGGYLGEEPRDSDDWFVTGDLGELDDDGSLRILGRADDVIVTGGENVDPAAVEVVLSGLMGVDGVMVVGVSSAEWGNEVVCLYAGTVSEAELNTVARDRLEAHQVPKQWIKVEQIPTTSLGKPDRAAGRTLLS